MGLLNGTETTHRRVPYSLFIQVIRFMNQAEIGSLLQLVSLMPEFHLGGFEVPQKSNRKSNNNSKNQPNKQKSPKQSNLRTCIP